MKYNTLAFSLSLILGSQLANANPIGGQVVHGSATFTIPSTNVLNVTNSNNTVINWQSFNIGAGQTTNFIQPSSASSVLNRVMTNSPSQLLGNLNSNGRVFLINQHGILVGEGAQVNTAGFFASTLNITDSDYLNGRLKFEGDSAAGINNQGYIHAGDNGNIVLIAPNIENGGVIEVDNGNVILAAGQSITISSLENPSIQFEVTGNENTVTNLGKILVDQGSASLFAGTLQHSGLIRAGGLVQNADGSISLVAKGSNQVSGEVDASGYEGGYIEVLGDTVTLENGAKINASGTNAGGEILIGGDQQGLNPAIQNATSTTVSAGANVNADATDNGNGGKVIIFAENDVHVHGNVSARGGALAGNGGFIETSGLLSLDITSVPDASAANGLSGEWLIDPNNITIINGTGLNISGTADFLTTDDGAILDVNLINFALNNGQNVTISTGDADANSSSGGVGTEAGDITIQTSITKSSGADASLTLNAHNNIIIDAQAGGTIDITSTSGVMNLALNADADSNGTGFVEFNTGVGNSFPITINTNGGTLTTNTDVSIVGDVLNTFSSVSILNTQWIIPFQTSLRINEDLNLDAPGTVVQNFGEISIGDSLSAYFPTFNITGDTLNLAPGSLLSGFGYLTGDVTVDGGVIMGGDGLSIGTLSISGALTMNSGGLYALLEAPDGIISSYVSAGSVAINGGDLILNWLDSTQANNAKFAPGPGTSLVGCAFTGCLTVSGFDAVADPIAVSTGVVAYGSLYPDNVTYTVSSMDAGSIYQWTGLVSTSWSDLGNWLDLNSGLVPTLAPDSSTNVFIDGSGTPVVDITTPVAVNGIQAHAQIKIGSGGSLDIAGNAFILDPNNADGGLSIAASDARLSRTGSGVLYNLGSTLKLDQGTLSADTVNWGEIQTTAGTAFQLDGNLVNNALFALDANSGINTFTGTGSIDNKAIMSWANGASLTLDGVSLSSASNNAQFQGVGLLTLRNGAAFAVDVAPQFYDEGINWDLIAGAVSGVENIPVIPHVIQLLSGGEIRGAGSMIIPNTTTFTVYDGSFQGTDINNPLSVDVASSLQVQSGNLTLNNTDLTVNSTASLTGTGGLLIAADSSLVADGLIQLANLDLIGGTLTANNLDYAGNMLWDAGTIDGLGLTTSGNVDLVSGNLNTDWTITPTGTVSWFSPSSGSLLVNAGTITNQGTFTVNSYVDLAGQGAIAAKNLTGTAGARFINEGLLIIDADAYPSVQGPDVVVFDLAFDNVGGTVGIQSGTFRLESAGVAQDLVLDAAGESLQGYGVFDGNVVNTAGTVSPGKSDPANSVFNTGTLSITGDYTQGVNGALVIKMDSTASGLVHDKLNVGGALNAGGDIKFAVINGKTPTQLALLLDQSFKPLSYGTFANRFDTVDIPAGLNFTFSNTGVISISSDSQVLNDIANQLEVLFDNTELNHPQLVRAMRLIDEGVKVATGDEEDDEKKRAPRLVCR